MDLACKEHPESPARARCVDCGATLCGTCRVKVGGRSYCRPCVPEKLRGKLKGSRSPAAAAVLSAVPGLGQLYSGAIARGLAFLGGGLLVAGNVDVIPHPVPLFLWVFNLFDAFLLASERNLRVAGRPQDPSLARQRRFFGLFAAGVGAFTAARATLVPELDPDLIWPGALLLYGLFLLFDRKESHVQHA